MNATLRFKQLVCACTILLIAACTNDPASLIKRAQEREAKGDHVAAIVDLKSALQQEPDNGTIRYQLGRLYNLTFDGPSAEKELRKAAELGVVEGGRVALELGRALVLQKKPQELLAAVVPTTAFEPTVLASVHALRGHANLTVGQVEEARNDLARTRKLDEQNIDGRLLEARFVFGERGAAAAMEIIEDLIARDQTNFEAWTYKVDLLSKQRKLDEVLAAYARLLELNPRHLDALVGRVGILVSQRKLDDAQNDINALRKYYPGHPVTGFLQGEILFAKGKFREALETAQVILKRYPDYEQAILLSGMAHLALGAPVQAERELTRYLQKNPRNTYARRVLATARLEMNKGEKALETIEPFVKSDTKDAALLALVGDAYSRIGEYSRAAEWLQRSVAASPDNLLALSKQAQVRFAAGEIDLAISDLQRVAALSKEITEADTALALGYMARRDYDNGLKAIEAMEKKSPKSPIPSNLRGLLWVEKGDDARAVKYFDAALRLDAAFVPAAINLAKLDMKVGNSDMARQRFEGVLKADDKNLDALIAYATVEEITGRRREAMNLLDRAVKAHPRALEPKARLVRLLVHENDKQRAQALAAEAYESFPDHPLAIEMLGGVQMWNGEQNTALATLGRLTGLFPKWAEGFYKLAAAQLIAGRSKEAESNLRKALALREGFAPAETMLLQLLINERRVNDAVAFVRKVQKESPKSARGYLLEADLWTMQDKSREAIEPLNRALALDSSAHIAVKLFRVRAQAGDRAGAKAELQAWAEKHPTEPLARGELADALLRDGEFKAAAAHYERMLEASANNPFAMNNLAWAYFNLKDSRALTTAEAAYRRAPNDPNILDTYGWILVQSGQLDRGLSLLGKAAAAAPRNLDIRFHWAAALAKSGNKDQARKELSALAANASFGQANAASALLQGLN